MKNIIQRNLPLTQVYNLIETKYIPVADGVGCTCDNCGKLIANIATMKGSDNGKTYTIGFDCLDTILINNQILQGQDIDNYLLAKKSMRKVKQIKEYMNEFLTVNPHIVFVSLITEPFLPGWLNYEFFNAIGKKVWNDGTKIKELHMPTLLATLRSVNKKVGFAYRNEDVVETA